MARLKKGDKGQSTVIIKNKKSKGSFKKGKGTKVKSKKSHSAKATGKLSGKLKDVKGRETIKREEGAESTAAGSDKMSSKKNKVLPKNKKERKMCRRQQRDDYALTVEAKSSWERLRRHKMKASERKELMEKLLTSISGQIHQLSVKHDTARVVQCCLKFGSRSQRTTVFNELKDHIVELSKLKYAKFTVKSLLKYCTALERGHVISSLYGRVRRMVRHTEAAEILEIAYNDYANAGQRAALVKEFYGPQFSLFKDETTPTTLSELLKEKPELRASVMKHLKEAILPLLDKKVVTHSIVHRVLLEYFNNCTDEERSEMIESVKEVVVHMLHTKEGSRVAMTTLWHGTAKDRKAVLKSFKTYVAKICKEDNGHLVMMSLFDSVDDTVLVRKVILSEIIADLEDICDDPFGKRVLLYLLAPRCPAHFSPQFIAILNAGDGNPHSKKDSALRWAELRGVVIKPLLELAGKKVCLWAVSKCHSPLLLQIADSATSAVDLSEVYSALVSSLCSEYVPDNHLLDDASAHWVLKRLLAQQEKGKVLSDLLLEKVPLKQMSLWSGTNRGAFVLSALVPHLHQGIPLHQQVVTSLKEGLPVDESQLLKGQEVLMKQLDTFSKETPK